MVVLTEWLGKADNLSLAFDACIQESQMLPGEVARKLNLPAIRYPETDNIRDVADATWENNVSKADQIDYLMAICSGTISGLIDVFYVGEISLDHANEWGTNKVNKFVLKIAELHGFKGDDLSDAIKHLEKNYGFAADSVMQSFGGGPQHHLRDFSHHFSLGGLLCSLFTQFTGKVIGTDASGALRIVELIDKAFIGKNFEEKILFGTVNWFFHMVSDMAGSKLTAGKGTGIPGPLVSLIKEISTLPCFKDKRLGEHEFHVWISKLFTGTLSKRDVNGKIVETHKFDLRTEIGILHEIGRQFIPVLINECLVRGLYFIRRLYIAVKDTEIHSIADLNKIDASILLPFNNRVIRRMITVASGVFTAIDTVDAAFRAAIKSGGSAPTFFVNFAVRINVVGIGRFIIACMADGQFISEDMREAKEQKDKNEKKYEKLISDLKALSLDYDQMRVLNSIELLILEDDLKLTQKDEENKLKTEWKEQWTTLLTDNLSIVSETAEDYFLPEEGVIKYIEETKTGPWLFLIAMEAMLFSPYYALFGNEKKDKALKKSNLKSKYLTERFTTLQTKVNKEDFINLHKAYKRSSGIITGSTRSVAIGTVGTVVSIVATGGVAFVFAPAIATFLVGEAAAGLSGAALASYSLAAIGGGSLAVGGFGMAGGTAIITGGGALVGMLGGTGISAATAVSLLSDNGYVLSECCKLITFSKEILTGKYDNVSAVEEIQLKVESRLREIQNQIDSFSTISDLEENGTKKKEIKLKVKVAKKSSKYLKRTDNELKRIIKSCMPAKKKKQMAYSKSRRKKK